MFVLLTALACGPKVTPLTPDQIEADASREAQNLAAVQTLMSQGFAQGDVAVIEATVSERYVQHSPMAEDGREGLVALVQGMEPGSIQVHPKRVLADGDLVAIHSAYELGGQSFAVFDVFRLEQGRVVEHWDAWQAQPETTVSGRTMLDGPTEVVDDPERTEANRALARVLVEEGFVEGRMMKAMRVIDGDNYAQHNPGAGDDMEGLITMMKELEAQGVSLELHTVHNLIAQGNFVLSQSEGLMGDQPTAFYDLFRFEDGKVVEHWDVIQPIPESFPHDNGMF